MKIFRAAPPTLLVALLALGVYQLAKPTGGDAAISRESMSGPAEEIRALADTAPATPERRAASVDGPIAVSSAPEIPQYASNPGPSHHPTPPFAHAPTTGPDENGVESDTEVSVIMADGSTQTFTGSGVMFSPNGKAMQIPEGGYRVLSDGTLMPDPSLDARTVNATPSP